MKNTFWHSLLCAAIAGVVVALDGGPSWAFAATVMIVFNVWVSDGSWRHSR